MKVIFLDFDGVINNRAFGERNFVEERFVNILKRIVGETNALIVVSSANKNELFRDLNKGLKESEVYTNYFVPLMNMGIKISDVTPFVKSDGLQDREAEIKAYLRKHPGIEQYVIIEDDNIITSLAEHQVLIEYGDGLKEEHIEPAIKILHGDLGFYPPIVDINEPFRERFQRILKYHNISIKGNEEIV